MAIQERLTYGELGAKHIGWTVHPQAATEVFITAVSHNRHQTSIEGIEVSNGLPNLISFQRAATEEVTVSWGARLATVESSWEGTAESPEPNLSITLPPGHYVPRDGRLGARGGWQVQFVHGSAIKLIRARTGNTT
ncbi:hypothetical protein LG293_16555 (plasmid) [Citricoccus nitrophenolicus]